MVGHGHHPGAVHLEDAGRGTAHVAEALDADGGAGQVEADLVGPVLEAEHHALAGGLFASRASAGLQRLAGHDALDVLTLGDAGGIGVGVHHPDHRLGVGPQVGRRNVVVGTDVAAQGVGEASDDPLQLVGLESAGVERDAALCSAERDVTQSRLPRHPRSQGLDLVEVDHGVESDSALVGTQQIGMLDAVAPENPVGPVVETHREVHDDLVLGLGEDRPQIVGEVDQVGATIELVQRGGEQAGLGIGHGETLRV